MFCERYNVIDYNLDMVKHIRIVLLLSVHYSNRELQRKLGLAYHKYR